MSQLPQTTLEFAPDRSTAGFRLHHFALLNWGTFHGRVHHFSPDGRTSLLSGSNGAGKSTLADAVLTLLIDSRKRNYNQASAGGGERKQRKERSEKDYILGTYSEEHDQELGYGRPKQLRRPGESVTVLLANFYNETYQQDVTLAQVLCLTPSRKRVAAYIVAKRKLTIDGDFSDLGGPSEFMGRLKERGLDPLDSFTAYSQRFHEALFLSTERNPMDIFNQAVCIKDISNLTGFIREYMLDDGGAPKKLEELRENFEELRRTYERIQREKDRLEKLDTIRFYHNKTMVKEDQIQHWQSALEATPIHFAREEVSLREAEAESISLELTKAKAEEVSESIKADQAEEKIRQLTSAIESSDAGRRLQQIEKDLLRLEQEVADKRKVHQRFMREVETWRKGIACREQSDFHQILSEAKSDVAKLAERLGTLEQSILTHRNECQKIEEQQHEANLQIRSLQEREGKIDDRLIQIRNQIAKDLGKRRKDLPFVGELVQVRESEERWTGAIERLVHSFALCVLVPFRMRAEVDQYVDKTNLRGLLVYHALDSEPRRRNPQCAQNSVAGKLELHPDVGEFEDWLSSELSHRFDHICCESTEGDFQRARTAITVNGLIKQRGSERRKDDRRDINDRSRDVLGWDNKAKIRALQKQNSTLESKRDQLLDSIRRESTQREDAQRAHNAAQNLPKIAESWNEIDYFRPSMEQEALRIEKKQLEADSDELSRLQSEKKKAETSKLEAMEKSKAATQRIGQFTTNQNQNNEGIQACQAILAGTPQEPEQLERLQEKIKVVKDLIDFPPTSIKTLLETRREVQENLERNRRKALQERDQAGTAAKEKIIDFLNAIQREDARLHDELYPEGLQVPGYSRHLFEPFEALRLKIQDDDLPQHEKRFNQKLQRDLIEDVSSFDGLLLEHAETIKRRIDDLNEHLKEVDFDRNRHSYIQLVPDRADDDNQKWFRGHRQYALENIAHVEDSDEARTERFNRVRNLLDQLAIDEKRTQRVIDVRNWFNFRADEFLRDGDEYIQSYTGASGKSGGEKNRLASTILATAIAYQYGISLNNDHQTETFRLVVVDEMFSKTDDEFSTYLLELFKQFSLQLIIVQPLDSKIHLVQKYAERYHIVTRPGTHSEIHNLDVHEYEKHRSETTVGET